MHTIFVCGILGPFPVNLEQFKKTLTKFRQHAATCRQTTKNIENVNILAGRFQSGDTVTVLLLDCGSQMTIFQKLTMRILIYFGC